MASTSYARAADRLAVLVVRTERDAALIEPLMEDIRRSMFGEEPQFVIVDGAMQDRNLSAALNAGLATARECGRDFVFWAHPDMQFRQPNWHIPLMRILDTKRSVMKICAANTRDAVAQQPRLDQEQAWMVRTCDPLVFDTEFIGIGGYEDWWQSYEIIASGYLVLVTPESQVWHAGMGTRKLRDTTAEQQHNNGVFCKRLGNDDNPHRWSNFGKALAVRARAKAWSRAVRDFPQFAPFAQELP